MSSFVSIKTKDGTYQSFKVPEEVKTYIMQLENAVRYPEYTGAIMKHRYADTCRLERRFTDEEIATMKGD